MFDTIASPSRRRSGAAAAGSIAAHAAAIAIAVLVTGVRPPPPPPPILEVRVLPPRSGTPLGRDGTSQPPRPPDRSPGTPKRPRLTPTRTVAPAPEPPEASAPEPAHADEPGPGTPGGPSIGDPDGEGGGGPSAPAVPGPTLEYESGKMTPPRQISGPDPEYTLQALQNDVQGLIVVRCIVTVEGTVRRCRVLQGLPFMDRAAVEALEQRRYAPAKFPDGRPVEVEYTFHIRLQLP